MLCCVLIIHNHYHVYHTSEKHTASISNTKAGGLCLLCCGPQGISSRGHRNLLHFKKWTLWLFGEPEPAAPPNPLVGRLADFHVISKPREFIGNLKSLKIQRFFTFQHQRAEETKKGGTERKRERCKERELYDGWRRSQRISVATPRLMGATTFEAPQSILQQHCIYALVWIAMKTPENACV